MTKDPEDTGKFFGEIDGRLMERLVLENIYEEVNVTDYQAVCYMNTNEGNPANILQTVRIACVFYFLFYLTLFNVEIFVCSQPFLYIFKLIKWTIKLLAWAIVQTSLLPVDANEIMEDYGGKRMNYCAIHNPRVDIYQANA